MASEENPNQGQKCNQFLTIQCGLDCSQSLFYFVPQEKILTAKQARLVWPENKTSTIKCDQLLYFSHVPPPPAPLTLKASHKHRIPIDQSCSCPNGSHLLCYEHLLESHSLCTTLTYRHSSNVLKCARVYLISEI